MSINAIRFIKYVDDGVDAYQCLNCYKIIETRNDASSWLCCPYCTTKFEKFIPQKIKKYYPENPQRLETVNLLSYKIQERMIFDQNDVTNWETVAETFGYVDTVRVLKWYRNKNDKREKWESDTKYEYRFVVKDTNTKK